MKKPVHRARRKAKSDPLSLPIEDLNLSIRLLNCLKHDDIKTLGDITRRTATDLALLPKFGSGCLRETIRVLRRYGLSLYTASAGVRGRLRVPRKSNVSNLNR
jgi:DNA-directed RNA polymerase alpha subunit